jgi:hypothetical protein
MSFRIRPLVRTRSCTVLGLAATAAAALAVLVAPPAGAADAPQATAAAQPAASTRAPDAAERAAMFEILEAESAPERAAWIVYGAGNAEGKELADALAAVFRDAGWKVETKALTGMVLKPGVSMLFAEEQPPPWTDAAQRAMQASGIEIKSATGYRPYYEEKKAENAAWPGVPIGAGQEFVIVLGPEPKA